MAIVWKWMVIEALSHGICVLIVLKCCEWSYSEQQFLLRL